MKSLLFAMLVAVSSVAQAVEYTRIECDAENSPLVVKIVWADVEPDIMGGGMAKGQVFISGGRYLFGHNTLIHFSRIESQQESGSTYFAQLGPGNVSLKKVVLAGSPQEAFVGTYQNDYAQNFNLTCEFK